MVIGIWWHHIRSLMFLILREINLSWVEFCIRTSWLHFDEYPELMTVQPWHMSALLERFLVLDEITWHSFRWRYGLYRFLMLHLLTPFMISTFMAGKSLGKPPCRSQLWTTVSANWQKCPGKPKTHSAYQNTLNITGLLCMLSKTH